MRIDNLTNVLIAVNASTETKNHETKINRCRSNHAPPAMISSSANTSASFNHPA
jgi:hypothetical protein